MKDSKTKVEESTRLVYTGLRHISCHTYLEFRRGRQCLSCSVPRIDGPVYMGVNEGGDGEVECSETPSLLSYTLRYVGSTR